MYVVVMSSICGSSSPVNNHFDLACTAADHSVYQQLEGKPSVECDISPTRSDPARGDADHAESVEEYRSKSAEPVLVSSRGVSESANDEPDDHLDSPWLPGDVSALTKRLSGSTRLYEDPDVDEYDNMDDLGYVRRTICDQQDFILHHLDAGDGPDCEPYFHHNPEQQDTHSITPSDSGASSTAAPETPVSMTEPAAPPPAAAGGGSGGSALGGGGFGFSFPMTTPSAVDAAVHEERAERVFSTWASNNSRSGLDMAGASDDEGQ
eukprot:gene2224-2537_t